MTFDEILDQARKNAANIDKIGKKLDTDLASYFPTQLKQLNDCLDTYSAAKVMIATTVADASGELTLENAAKLAANFDKNWDKFAKEYNAIFSHLPEASKTNVLETFAKARFGTKVFEAGSVIKNETPSILSGIVSFRAGIDSFKGSFRDPQGAANKINNGVNLIVNSTAQVAGSLNNIVKFIQGGKSASASGNIVLEKLSQLPQMKAVAAATSVLAIGNSGIGAVNTGRGAIDALQKGDYATALSQGQATYKSAKKVVDELKRLKDGTMGAKQVQQIDGTKLSNPSDTNGQQPPASDDEEDSSKNADSYVCSTAKIKCSYGDKISTLTVFPDRTIWLTGQPQANISDHQSMQNIAPFGKCHTTAYPPTGSATAAAHGKLTPMPCVPNTPFPWMGGKDDVLLKGEPALLTSSKCKCIYGGTITITFNGQNNDVPKMEDMLKKEVFQ